MYREVLSSSAREDTSSTSTCTQPTQPPPHMAPTPPPPQLQAAASSPSLPSLPAAAAPARSSSSPTLTPGVAPSLVCESVASPGGAGARGPLHGVAVLSAYPLLEPLQQRRLAARRHNVTYCYDFPAVFEGALRDIWSARAAAGAEGREGWGAVRGAVRGGVGSC